jgi:hypothetical protein
LVRRGRVIGLGLFNSVRWSGPIPS